MEEFSRTELLIHKEGLQFLKDARVAVFGIGGVGGYVVEALVRSGLGHIDIFDHDTVSLSNINRQIIATHETVGLKKVDVMEKRIHDINESCIVCKHDVFFLPENQNDFDFSHYDYIVDAIDTVTAKILLAQIAVNQNIPIISSMGTGNKLNPLDLEVADISQTSVCPLARVMRRELKKKGIYHLKVVYSKEKPIETNSEVDPVTHKKVPGSVSFVPSVAGLVIASEVIKDLIKKS